MGQISPDYASPALRLGLLLHDHPQATYRFEYVKGTDIGIPPQFGGSGDFCLCTIEFGGDRAPVSAWKPVPKSGDADLLNTLQTKTMGRALKKVGYPDDLKDLKALVLWRQRSAEIDAITAGTQQLAITPTSAVSPHAIGAGDQLEQAFDAAATGQNDDDEVVAETVDSRVATVIELVESLSSRELAAYEGYLDTIHAPRDPADMTVEQLQDVLVWLDPEAE